MVLASSLANRWLVLPLACTQTHLLRVNEPSSGINLYKYISSVNNLYHPDASLYGELVAVLAPSEFALSRVGDPLEGIQEELPGRARVHGAVDARDVGHRLAHGLGALLQEVQFVLVC